MTDYVPPLAYKWDGEALRPVYPRRADQYLVIGEHYTMAPWEDRSQASHGHEFAWLTEAWRNLPEALADDYPTPEHLRKRGLIQAGYFDEQVIEVGSNAAAIRVARAIRSREEFSYVAVRGGFVVIRTAKSQARRAMKNAEFQASKEALMAVVAGMLEVSPAALRENAEHVA